MAQTVTTAAEATGLFGWWRVAPPAARRALVAAALGWMLDAFDVMLYSMVVASLLSDFGLTKGMAGLLGSLTLAASAAGGVLFGIIADRRGRKIAMIGSILVYSVFTGACGLAQTIGQLAVFRLLLGLGMGGEWTAGAALVSETWPDRHRGKALGVMQSSWAVGYAAAAVVTALVLPRFGWRARKRSYVIYLLAAAVLTVSCTSTSNATVLLALGPLVAFFGTGYFSGFGAITAEIYPTEIRATAQGFTFNVGRVGSAFAPFIVGSLAQTNGFAIAFLITAAAFLLAAAMWFWIPETGGRTLR